MRKRRRLMVSWGLQGPVLIRLVVHMTTFVSALASMMMLVWLLMGDVPTESIEQQEYDVAFWYGFVPFIVCGIALIPLILWDMLRITNRIAGPLHRFEVLLRQFEQTGYMPKATLRDNDLMMDFCDNFNRFVATLHERYPECAPPEDSPSTDTPTPSPIDFGNSGQLETCGNEAK